MTCAAAAAAAAAASSSSSSGSCLLAVGTGLIGAYRHLLCRSVWSHGIILSKYWLVYRQNNKYRKPFKKFYIFSERLNIYSIYSDRL